MRFYGSTKQGDFIIIPHRIGDAAAWLGGLSIQRRSDIRSAGEKKAGALVYCSRYGFRGGLPWKNLYGCPGPPQAMGVWILHIAPKDPFSH